MRTNTFFWSELQPSRSRILSVNCSAGVSLKTTTLSNILPRAPARRDGRRARRRRARVCVRERRLPAAATRTAETGRVAAAVRSSWAGRAARVRADGAPRRVGRHLPLAASVYVSGGRAAGLAVGDRCASAAADGGRAGGGFRGRAFGLVPHRERDGDGEDGRPRGEDRASARGRARAVTFARRRPRRRRSAPIDSSGDSAGRAETLGRLTGGVTLGYSGFWDASAVEPRPHRARGPLRRLRARPGRPAPRGAGARHQPPGRPQRASAASSCPARTRGTGCTRRRSRTRRWTAGVRHRGTPWRPSLRQHRIPRRRAGRGAPGLERPGRRLRGQHAGGDGGPAGGSKAGGFVRIAPRETRLHYEVVVSGVRENQAGEVSREYLGLQGQLRAGGLWLYQRAEVDLNRGWREERAGTSAQLSDLRSLAELARVAHALGEPVLRAPAQLLGRLQPRAAGGGVRRPAQQTLRADIDLARGGAGGVWAGGSVRLREGDDRDGVRRARRRPHAALPVPAHERRRHALPDGHHPGRAGHRPPRAGTCRAAIASTPPTTSTATTCAETGPPPEPVDPPLRLWPALERGLWPRRPRIGFGNDLRGVRALLEGGISFLG